MKATVRVVCVFVLFLMAVAPSYAAIKQTYVSGNFVLEIDGATAGWLKSIDGGSVVAEVVEELPPSDYYVKKHLEDPPSYSKITIGVGSGMSPAIYQWIQDTLNGDFPRKSGSIVATDYKGDAIWELEFQNAYITQVTFPRLDASSKNPAQILVQLSPQFTVKRKASGKVSISCGKNQSQKTWLSSNFRFAIKGLDTTRVNAVESISVQIPIPPPPEAECVSCQPIPPSISFPEVEIRLPEAFSQTEAAWFEDFVIKGNHTDADEKTGTLEFMDSTMKNSLFTLSFTGLGAMTLENEPASANTSAVSQVRFRMYTEIMSFAANTGACP